MIHSGLQVRFVARLLGSILYLRVPCLPRVASEPASVVQPSIREGSAEMGTKRCDDGICLMYDR